jgi:OOP family OmpA-OmpF porin
MKKLVLVSMLTLSAAAAQAQNLYGDVAYQILDTDLDTNPAVVRGIIGYTLNPNFAVEGMLGLNARDGSLTQSGVTAKTKLDRLVGVYAKSTYKINDAFELYGRLGAVSYKVSASASAGGFSSKVSDSGTDLSFGIGASYYLTPALSINVDYTDFGDLENGVAVGLKFSF